MEVAVLVGEDGEPLYWHAPAENSSVSIPDSTELWAQIWEHRERLRGIAHSHPGDGFASPSHEDITTFRAIELALGRSLMWWITTKEHAVTIRLCGPNPLDFSYLHLDAERESLPRWLNELRKRSKYDNE